MVIIIILTQTAAAEMYEMCENHGRRYGAWILSTKTTTFTGTEDGLPPCSVDITRADLSRDEQVRLPLFRMTEHSNSWLGASAQPGYGIIQ